MVVENLCPVCGFEMDDPPKDYNICPSCGTEFGVHDHNASIVELRTAWIRSGPKWWSKTDPKPENWNPFTQLATLVSGCASLSECDAVFVIKSSSTTATAHSYPIQIANPAGWAVGWAPVRPEGTEHASVSS